MIATNQYAHETSCVHCGSKHVIMVDRADLESWLAGEVYIQDALDYLTPAERELLISQTCDTCWKRMWGED